MLTCRNPGCNFSRKMWFCYSYEKNSKNINFHKFCTLKNEQDNKICCIFRFNFLRLTLFLSKKVQPERLERYHPCWLLKLRQLGTQRVQMKGAFLWLVCWACHYGTRGFCPALALLVGPVQNIFFLTWHYNYIFNVQLTSLGPAPMISRPLLTWLMTQRWPAWMSLWRWPRAINSCFSDKIMYII